MVHARYLPARMKSRSRRLSNARAERANAINYAAVTAIIIILILLTIVNADGIIDTMNLR